MNWSTWVITHGFGEVLLSENADNYFGTNVARVENDNPFYASNEKISVVPHHSPDQAGWGITGGRYLRHGS